MTGCSADGDALELILGKLDGVRPRGGYWMARCPAHDDGEASLSVKRGTEQPVILHCFAECERDAILDAIGLTLADISKPREQHEDDWTPFGPAVATYIYTDAAGKVLFGVCSWSRTGCPGSWPRSTRARPSGSPRARRTCTRWRRPG